MTQPVRISIPERLESVRDRLDSAWGRADMIRHRMAQAIVGPQPESASAGAPPPIRISIEDQIDAILGLLDQLDSVQNSTLILISERLERESDQKAGEVMRVGGAYGGAYGGSAGNYGGGVPSTSR